MRMIEEHNKDSDLEDDNGSPFYLNILQALTPTGFRMPTTEPFDGTTNPRVHLMRYMQHMGVARTNEEVMCRCFLIFLTRLATMWFCRLDNGSISSWA